MLTSDELVVIKNTVGALQNAQRLFQPRVERNDIEALVSTLMPRLARPPNRAHLIVDMKELPEARRSEWAAQCWINTISEALRHDPAFRHAHEQHGSYAPRSKEAATPYIRAIDKSFQFFVWLVGWGGETGDVRNSFTLRMIFLSTAVLIENLQATTDGVPGGWGILDATVDLARNFGAQAGIPVRVIATNDQIGGALRRRGFSDPVAEPSLVYSSRARPLLLIPPA